MKSTTVGRTTVKQKSWGPETNIGFTAENLDLLKSSLNEKGWVNLILKTSKEGNPYLVIDTWAPKAAAKTEDLPF